MEKKSCRINHAEYFGLQVLRGNEIIPECSYFVRRYRGGSWLLELCLSERGTLHHIGTIDLMELLAIAGKSHLGVLKKDEFYDALDQMFDVDLRERLHAAHDVETVLERVASYSKQQAASKYAFGKL